MQTFRKLATNNEVICAQEVHGTTAGMKGLAGQWGKTHRVEFSAHESADTGGIVTMISNTLAGG